MQVKENSSELVAGLQPPICNAADGGKVYEVS